MITCNRGALSSCGSSSLCGSRPVASRHTPCERRGRRCFPVLNMKKDIHPKYFEEAKVICNGEEVLTVSGTKERYVVDVWSGNHPFFQGTTEQLILDEGRVSKFNKRFGTIGAYGQVAPASAGGDKKLEFKSGKEKDKGKKGKGKK